MYFGLHTTKKVEREKLFERDDYKIIEISPYDLHSTIPNKPIVWEEDTGNFYQHPIKEFFLVLKSIDDGQFDSSPYIKRWGYKGHEPYMRMARLQGLYEDIKKNGIKEPVSVEATGERLDGSFRTKIAIHLGIKKVKAKLFCFKWQDIDEGWIERKLKARDLSSGKDYYSFSYGYKDWVNVKASGSYAENSSEERVKVFENEVEGNVLDIGCNEGFMSLWFARKGHKVYGIDEDWIHIANLNKLIYEWIDKKDLDCEFEQGDIKDLKVPKDTNTVLLLNVIYHLKYKEELLKKLKGKKLIFQCNLRKEKERDKYYGSHPEDLKKLLKDNGFKVVKEIEWRDKPIIIAQ